MYVRLINLYRCIEFSVDLEIVDHILLFTDNETKETKVGGHLGKILCSSCDQNPGLLAKDLFKEFSQ